MTTVDPMALMDDAPIELKVTESRAARRARLSTGGLLVGLGVLLAILSFRARGDAAFALSDAFAAVPLPTIVVPGMATALVCGLITAVVGAGFLTGRLHGLACASLVAAVARRTSRWRARLRRPGRPFRQRLPVPGRPTSSRER
jgi:hypothetical protein